ncbi:MAG TPA: hypothetical protein P5560_12325 [Thermotogota bacterium]|nr:hypothetical protein [Thermotogota bacterium]
MFGFSKESREARQEKKEQEKMHNAFALGAQGRLDEAKMAYGEIIQKLEQKVAKDPENALWRARLGHALAMLAKVFLRQMLGLEKERNQQERSQLHKQICQLLEEAKAEYQQAMLLDPKEDRFFSHATDVRNTLGFVEVIQGNRSRALEHFEGALRFGQKALERQPQNPEAHFQEGNAFSMSSQVFVQEGQAEKARQRMQEAISCFERAVGLSPRQDEYRHSLEDARKRLERMEGTG